jgi:AcrR family transcriptional regulator
MGSHERRTRARHELRLQILQAARAIAAREGWQAVTMRKIAEVIEYTPPTIYEHFASKEALLYALIAEGEQLLLAELQTAHANAADPQAALHSMAQAYWQFAFRHPELYQAMHGMDGVPFCDDLDAAELGHAIFRFTREAMFEFVGKSDPVLLDQRLNVLWATLHGLVALTMVGNLEGGADANAPLVDQAVATLVAGWTATT